MEPEITPPGQGIGGAGGTPPNSTGSAWNENVENGGLAINAVGIKLIPGTLSLPLRAAGIMLIPGAPLLSSKHLS